jgi:hypothetical protein
MSTWETMPIVAALLLATVAAVMSSGPEVSREVTSYVAAALTPPASDLGEIAE